ncbi:MAG: NAD(P) transhydrogenase subunit alpha [Bacteroidota bacterium]
MKIGILKETNDRRVALVPTTLKRKPLLAKSLLVEQGAGWAASFPDEAYAPYATITSRAEVLAQAQLLLSIHPLPETELQHLSAGTVLVALFQPYNNPNIVKQLQQYQLQAFSLDMIPRSTLAQSMDVLSSMASIAGYKAVLTAATYLPRYFPMMITAAGSIRPAKVLILGAGVAGLQAIATARRLGAMVEASDVRQAAKEEVESLGAKFVEVEGASEDRDAGGYAVAQSEDFLQRQREEVQRRAAKADVVITTAQVRGRKAPLLLPTSTVEQMKAGSVVVDLASSTGGNCELSEDQQIIQHRGVTIIGNSALAESMPQDASTLFSNNAANFIQLLLNEAGDYQPQLDHEILAAALITKKQASPDQNS